MSTMFQTASPTRQKLDPLKRVNYTFGLVLGVAEFQQSDTYFLAKHHMENRLLHGYGTVCGLDVTSQTSPQVEVQVTPGWAINPKGQEIYVPQVMCVQVNDWLQANLTALQLFFPGGKAPANLGLCVVLCYRECKTDVVPIPGEPCQTQSSAMAPSRIADSFELMLCLDPDLSPPAGSPPSASSGLCEFSPSMVENSAVSAFAALLSEIQPSATGPFVTQAEVEQLVRNLVQPVASPPAAPTPAGPPFYVAEADADNFRRGAILTWITEVLPSLAASQGVSPCCPPPEKCVLLAQISLSLNANWAATAVNADKSRRPFLMSTLLLQELALKQLAASGYRTVAAGYFHTDGTPSGPSYNLTAAPASPPNGEYTLSFAGYQNPAKTPGINYIVKGTVQDSAPTAARATLELVGFETSDIRIRILDTTLKPLATGMTFMVEISAIGVGL